jgi:hypothetical protein
MSGFFGQLTFPQFGLWTPVIGGSTGTSGQTYTKQLGIWVKWGKLVIAQFTVALSNKGVITGSAQIQGLPFPNLTLANWDAVGLIGYWANLNTAYNMISIIFGSGTGATLLGTTGPQTTLPAVPVADISNTTEMIGIVIYTSDN